MSWKAPFDAVLGVFRIGLLSYDCVGVEANAATPSKPGVAYVDVITHYGPGRITAGPPQIYTWPEPWSLEAMREEIRALRERVDVVMVGIHMGLVHFAAARGVLSGQRSRTAAVGRHDTARTRWGRPGAPADPAPERTTRPARAGSRRTDTAGSHYRDAANQPTRLSGHCRGNRSNAGHRGRRWRAAAGRSHQHPARFRRRADHASADRRTRAGAVVATFRAASPVPR